MSRAACAPRTSRPAGCSAAEAAASAFIEHQAATTQIGIVAFGGFAELIQAPTTDAQALLDALHSLATGRRTAVGQRDPRIASTRSPRWTRRSPPTPARARIRARPVPTGAYAPDIIVVLTDGASNAGPDPLEAAQQAVDRGVRVYTIGFGTANGGVDWHAARSSSVGSHADGFGSGGVGGGAGAGGRPGGFRRGIDEATLTQVADETGGTYYPAESGDDLEKVFANLPVSLIIRHEVVEAASGSWAWPHCCSAAAFLLGRAWRPLP